MQIMDKYNAEYSDTWDEPVLISDFQGKKPETKAYILPISAAVALVLIIIIVLLAFRRHTASEQTVSGRT
jgi:hypothetical protein